MFDYSQQICPATTSSWWLWTDLTKQHLYVLQMSVNLCLPHICWMNSYVQLLSQLTISSSHELQT